MPRFPGPPGALGKAARTSRLGVSFVSCITTSWDPSDAAPRAGNDAWRHCEAANGRTVVGCRGVGNRHARHGATAVWHLAAGCSSAFAPATSLQVHVQVERRRNAVPTRRTSLCGRRHCRHWHVSGRTLGSLGGRPPSWPAMTGWVTTVPCLTHWISVRRNLTAKYSGSFIRRGYFSVTLMGL